MDDNIWGYVVTVGRHAADGSLSIHEDWITGGLAEYYVAMKSEPHSKNYFVIHSIPMTRPQFDAMMETLDG